MLKRLSCLLLALLLLLPAALAEEGTFLVPDSDVRLLTEKELRQWDYESLGYILHEIYARHGYHFTPGSEYESYFAGQSWYTPSAQNNVDGCFAAMSDIEWANADLIQQIQVDMMIRADANPDGRSLWSSDPVIAALNFQLASFEKKLKFSVYAAPSSKAWRGASGKASVSTNDNVWAAGWENGWLLIYYETSKGSVRVGYIDGKQFSGNAGIDTELIFAYAPAQLTAKTALTDDIIRMASSITTLKSGAKVTYLAPYYAEQAWAYVETKYDGKTVRGFVPLENIEFLDAE